MIWEKTKNHFFNGYSDDITERNKKNKINSVIENAHIEEKKLMEIKKISGDIINSKNIIMVFLIGFILLLVFGDVTSTTNNVPIVTTEDSLKKAAIATETTVISSNVPVETITSIEHIKNEGTKTTTEIVNATEKRKKEIKDIIETFNKSSKIKQSPPTTVVINTLNNKEIAFIHESMDSTPPLPIPILKTEPEIDSEVISTLDNSDTIKSNTEITPLVTPITATNEKDDTATSINIVKKESAQVDSIKTKENEIVSKEKLQVLEGFSNLFDDEINSLPDLEHE